MYSVSVSLLLLELCFTIPKAVRSQGSFQYDPYPIHIFFGLRYRYFLGNVTFNLEEFVIRLEN